MDLSVAGKIIGFFFLSYVLELNCTQIFHPLPRNIQTALLWAVAYWFKGYQQYLELLVHEIIGFNL